jgi:hypothetical protein
MIKYLFLIFLLFSSCFTEKSLHEDEEKVFINVDGHSIELVVDEYENPYLKQKTGCGVIYIPFTFPTEEDEIPQIYEVNKLKNHDLHQ